MQTEQSLTPFFIVIITVFIMLLTAFIVFILLFYQRKHIAYEQGIEKMRSDFEKTLLNSQLEMQEQTFQNISLEIHDNIKHSLTLIKRRYMNISRIVSSPVLEEVTGSIEDISKVMDDLSNISKALHTDFIKENGLLNTLDMDIKRMESLCIFEIHYEVKGEPVFMTDQKELVIYRILQEVFNNAINHSHATVLNVLVNYCENELHIELSDNGRGFMQIQQYPKKGTGQLNMTQRIALIKGTCLVQSLQGSGTTIKMNIPYETYE